MSSTALKVFEKLLHVLPLVEPGNGVFLHILHLKHDHFASVFHPEDDVAGVVAVGSDDARVVWESFL